jgi:arginyl-tRNA synthetase
MFESIKKNIKQALLIDYIDLEIDVKSIQLELLFDEKGDLTTNICMQYAKILSSSPKKIAESILQNFKHPLIKEIQLAGPGFINFFF